MHPLEKQRISRGYSRAVLAEMIGSTQEAIRLWERGDRAPSANWYPKLAKALKVSVGHIIEIFSAASAASK